MTSLLSARTPRSLSARLLPSRTDPSLYWGLWLFHSRSGPHPSLKLQAVLACPLPKMAVPSDVSSISKLGVGTFNPIIQIPYGDVEQRGAQHRSVEDPTCDRLPAGVKTIDDDPLSMTCESVPYPSCIPPIWSVFPVCPGVDYAEQCPMLC